MTADEFSPLILVAEDDDITRAITVKTLENAGYRVMSVADGQQAVDVCGQAYPLLVLMDAAMPVLDGFGACRRIKSSTDERIRSISVMMVTGLEDSEAIDEAFAAGAEDYVTKPVNWYILKRRLSVLLKKAQAESALRENEARFYAIAASASDAIISVDEIGNIVFWNDSAACTFGYDSEEILGKSLDSMIPELLKSDYQHDFDKAWHSGAFLNGKKIQQFKGFKKDGSVFLLELSMSAWTANSQLHYSCILRDISERVKKQEELKKLSMAVRQSPNLVLMTDLEGTVEYVNPQIRNITGYEYEEVVGRNMSMLCPGDTESRAYKELRHTITRGGTWSGTLQKKKKDGGLYWAKESVSPIFDDEGTISHFICIQEDVTEAKHLAEEVAYRAAHDPLTGLLNRHEFEVHLQMLIDKSKETDIHALCFIDLDRFKAVNDTAGHLAGDELLCQLTEKMKTIGRKQDVLARLGGDEFALILAHCELLQALQIAEKLRQLISEFQLRWGDYLFKVGASIGLATVTGKDNAGEVLKFADIACYAAKNTGRNKVYVFNEDDKYLNAQSAETRWLARIEQALHEDRFRLYMQPIVPLGGGASHCGHCEILLRLIDEDGEVIAPNAFLPAAERFHLMGRIDRWVIENALEWFSRHPDKLDELDCFSINLSGQSLSAHKIESFIHDLVDRLQFPAAKLVFEITETAAINNMAQARSLIAGLREIGIRFSLDDFGSGLSSFAYLKNLPVDFLKIDGMFIKEIASDEIDREMTRAINDIGHVMGKKTIAEFVENRQTIEVLNSLNIDYAQGYYYSKPMPLDS